MSSHHIANNLKRKEKSLRKGETEKSTANKIMDKITLFIVATLMLFNGIQGNNKRNKMHLRLLLFVLSYLENILLWKRGLNNISFSFFVTSDTEDNFLNEFNDSLWKMCV